jgi:hypothetical protein
VEFFFSSSFILHTSSFQEVGREGAALFIEVPKHEVAGALPKVRGKASESRTSGTHP